MNKTLIALGCTLALASACAFAQASTSGNDSGSGTTLTERAKEAAHAVGEKGREVVETVKEKAHLARHERDNAAPGAAAGDSTKKHADTDTAALPDCNSTSHDARKTNCDKHAKPSSTQH